MPAPAEIRKLVERFEANPGIFRREGVEDNLNLQPRGRFVVGEWIDSARELGRPIPAPRGRLMFV